MYEYYLRDKRLICRSMLKYCQLLNNEKSLKIDKWP